MMSLSEGPVVDISISRAKRGQKKTVESIKSTFCSANANGAVSCHGTDTGLQIASYHASKNEIYVEVFKARRIKSLHQGKQLLLLFLFH